MLYCDGRFDSLVKVNGFRIELEDVEENLGALPLVKQAAVVPVRRRERVAYLKACVVLRTVRRAPTSRSRASSRRGSPSACPATWCRARCRSWASCRSPATARWTARRWPRHEAWRASMTFYADPSFFALLALAVAGAAFLGLREKPLARYGMAASARSWRACSARTFRVDRRAGFVVVAALSTRWVLASPRSNKRFAVAFALILAPLLSAKVGAVFDQNLLGFMGVSYLTFKALQVLFEVRDGVIEEIGLFDYLYFLLFFPVFTSGPIDRSRRFAEDARAGARATSTRASWRAASCLCSSGSCTPSSWPRGCIASTRRRPGARARFWSSWPRRCRRRTCTGCTCSSTSRATASWPMGASYCFGIRTPRNFRAPFASRRHQGLLEPVEHHAVVLAARLRVHALLAARAEAAAGSRAG